MKSQVFLEHVNITVNDIGETIDFFKAAFPHFRVRGRGKDIREWVHFGDDDTYIAINKAKYGDSKIEKNYDSIGVNHVGFVVNNVDEIAKNLLENGYQRDFPKEIEQFRIRDYFVDKDGNQYEFVQYLSDKPEEKNHYGNQTEQ